MRKTAYLLLLLFVGFLVTPTIITYIDDSVDISMAFTASEEENSTKTPVGMEYTFHDPSPASISLTFLQEQAALNHSYKYGDRSVVLDVISPPPKKA